MAVAFMHSFFAVYGIFVLTFATSFNVEGCFEFCLPAVCCVDREIRVLYINVARLFRTNQNEEIKISKAVMLACHKLKGLRLIYLFMTEEKCFFRGHKSRDASKRAV